MTVTGGEVHEATLSYDVNPATVPKGVLLDILSRKFLVHSYFL